MSPCPQCRTALYDRVWREVLGVGLAQRVMEAPADVRRGDDDSPAALLTLIVQAVRAIRRAARWNIVSMLR